MASHYTFNCSIRVFPRPTPFSKFDNGDWFCLDNVTYAMESAGGSLFIGFQVYRKADFCSANPIGGETGRREFEPDALVNRVVFDGVKGVLGKPSTLPVD